jgi:hypothetical protein
VSYLVAFDKAALHGAEASTVALAVESTAWLVAYVVVARDRSRSNPNIRWSLAVMALIPSGVLIWMMLDLLRRGDALGVWSAVPIVAITPFAGALAAFVHRSPSGANAADGQPKTDSAAAEPESGSRPGPSTPATEPVALDATAPAEPDAAPRVEPDATVPNEAESAEPTETEMMAPIDVAPGEAATTPAETAATKPTEIVAAPPAKVDGEAAAEATSKKSPAKRSRKERLAVGVDEDFWSELTRSLSFAEREQGGVALTTSSDGAIVVVGVVLPQQVAATSARCEFSVLDVERVRDALDSLGDGTGIDDVRMTWLHTHPGLGVFLSGTDVATSANWRSLDPDFKPIVVDVSRFELADQIGVFGPDNRAINPIGIVSRAIDPEIARRIRQAVLDRYDREHVEAPEVIVGSAFSGSLGSA